jgi:hypothetical protein
MVVVMDVGFLDGVLAVAVMAGVNAVVRCRYDVLAVVSHVVLSLRSLTCSFARVCRSEAASVHRRCGS